MSAVPLGTEAYARLASSQPETRLVNLYMEEDKSGASPDNYMRLQRPGLSRVTTLPGSIRAIYQSDNSITAVPIFIAGDKFGFENGGQTIIATLANDGASARLAATFERVGALSAGEFHVWNGSTTIQVQLRDKEDADDPGVTLTDLPPIVDVDVLNGYYILATATGTFYWLVPGEITISPLNYATAEALPDGCIALRRLRDDLFSFGSDSIEVWQASGDADATFTRVPGRLVDRGCLSRDSVAVFDNSLVWVGDDGIVYRMSDTPQRISTFGIEERLKNRTDAPSAWVMTTLGHKFYVLTIPGAGTFAYDAATQIWSEFAWPVSVGVDTPQGALAGDPTGKLYRLDASSALDDGAPFQRLVTGTVAIGAKPIATSSLALGVGSTAPAIFAVRWHDPRRGWSAVVELQSRGEGDVLNAWRLGMARAPSRTFEISTTSPTVVRISGAVANEAWRV